MWFTVYQLHHSKAVIKTLRMAQSPRCLRALDAHAWTLRREVEEWGWGYGGWAGRDPGGRRPNSINALAATGTIPETDALGLRADPRVSNFPAPAPASHILEPEPGVGLDTGRGGAWGGSPHDPAHSSGDTLLSKILIPGPTHAFPQARLPGPAPCSLYGPAQGHTLRPQDPLPPSSRPRPTQDSGQTSPWPHGPSLGSAMSWPRPATQAPPMPRP